MSWQTIGILAVVLLAFVLAIAIVVPLLNRAFAFLGTIVDVWRPTPAGQARPGHDRLGVGVLFLATPVAAFLWYDIGPVLAELPNVSPLAILSLLIVMIITPLMGIMSLVSWKNSKLEFDGRRIRQTTMFGRQDEWEEVTRATMRPPFRGPGQVFFDLSGRGIAADSGWINVRDAYESLGRAGVQIEPWRERAKTWKDVWG